MKDPIVDEVVRVILNCLTGTLWSRGVFMPRLHGVLCRLRQAVVEGRELQMRMEI
jgi:hypothetical protein